MMKTFSTIKCYMYVLLLIFSILLKIFLFSDSFPICFPKLIIFYLITILATYSRKDGTWLCGDFDKWRVFSNFLLPPFVASVGNIVLSKNAIPISIKAGNKILSRGRGLSPAYKALARTTRIYRQLSVIRTVSGLKYCLTLSAEKPVEGQMQIGRVACLRTIVSLCELSFRRELLGKRNIIS